jgi:hypothetical protein
VTRLGQARTPLRDAGSVLCVLLWTVTVHSNSYEPDARFACDTWLQVHAMRWYWTRKHRRRVTVARVGERSRLGRWWADVWAAAGRSPGGVP